MKNRSSGKTQELSAAIAGISISTGYRIEKGKRMPKTPRPYRTRIDPLEKVWESVLVPLLKQEPKLTGLTLWEYLDDNFPGVYPYSLLRTLQRRIKTYNAEFGPAKDVIFRQSFPPGLQGLSDFTHPNTKITILGAEFKHLIYEFVLAYSGMRYAQIILGGESYSALANGLQNAFHSIGGVPLEHKTDSLSAAFRNSYEEMKLTKSYASLCSHYGIKAIRNTKGISHENGAVETAHGALKHRIAQAIKLRGSSDFATVEEYQQLINKQIKRLNKRSQAKFIEEQKALKPLPKARFMDYQVISTKVTTTSTIAIKTTLYSVPSKLIGENLKVHLYHDKLECFIGNHMTLRLKRVFAADAKSKARCINYKHVIDSLFKKPQAFRYSNIRDELMPSEDYAKLWIICNKQFDSHMACKWMVTVIKIATKVGDINKFAQSLLQTKKLPSLKILQDKYLLKAQVIPDIEVIQHQLDDYHTMFTAGHWQRQDPSEGVTQ